jgi:uncharacterized membrane protein YfcA
MAAFMWVILSATIVLWQLATRNEITIPSPEWYPWFAVMNWVTALAIVMSVFALASAITIWWREGMRWITRVKFTLVGMACVFLSWFAVHWHLIGPAHRI